MSSTKSESVPDFTACLLDTESYLFSSRSLSIFDTNPHTQPLNDLMTRNPTRLYKKESLRSTFLELPIPWTTFAIIVPDFDLFRSWFQLSDQNQLQQNLVQIRSKPGKAFLKPIKLFLTPNKLIPISGKPSSSFLYNLIQLRVMSHQAVVYGGGLIQGVAEIYLPSIGSEFFK